jgi:hypothetical protein
MSTVGNMVDRTPNIQGSNLSRRGTFRITTSKDLGVLHGYYGITFHQKLGVRVIHPSDISNVTCLWRYCFQGPAVSDGWPRPLESERRFAIKTTHLEFMRGLPQPKGQV